MPWIRPRPLTVALLSTSSPLTKLFVPLALRRFSVVRLVPSPTVNSRLLLNTRLAVLSVPPLNVTALPALVASSVVVQTVPPLMASRLFTAAPTPTVIFRLLTTPPLLTCSTLPVAAPTPIVRFCTAPVACQRPWFATITVLLEEPKPIVLAAAFVKL